MTPLPARHVIKPPVEWFDYRLLQVTKVVDGDTVDMVLDMGLHLSYTSRFRLLDVNTPERGEALWAEATEFTKQWFRDNANNRLRIRTYKTDSFGRWLAYVYEPVTMIDLSYALVTEGFAPYRPSRQKAMPYERELVYTRP